MTKVVGVDVQIGKRGRLALEAAGWVVIAAEHGEPDSEWFRRAVAAGATWVIAIDRDLEILAYDARIKCYVKRHLETGLECVERFLRAREIGDRNKNRRRRATPDTGL